MVGAFHDAELLPFNRKRWEADADMIAKAPAIWAENERLRPALAEIVGAFTGGVYCTNCGESVDDCECIINEGRKALR